MPDKEKNLLKFWIWEFDDVTWTHSQHNRWLVIDHSYQSDDKKARETLSPGQTDRQVVSSGRKLNLRRDLCWVAKRTRKFPHK